MICEVFAKPGAGLKQKEKAEGKKREEGRETFETFANKTGLRSGSNGFAAYFGNAAGSVFHAFPHQCFRAGQAFAAAAADIELRTDFLD